MATGRRRRARRQRDDFSAALRVLLHHHSDLVSGHSMQATLAALMATSRATRRTLAQWANEQLANDITRGHEARAIPIQAAPESAQRPHLQELLLLLRFVYTTRVLIPVARARHELPREECDRLRRENDDVARVTRECSVQLYAQYSRQTRWGVHAAERIPEGEYVGEYTGELVSSAEARRRHAGEYDRARLNYVLALREQTRGGGNGDGASVRTNVDATRFGSYARLFNHSCAPTLRVEAVRVDSFVPRLVFFAQRALTAGEQLTFDYGCGASARPESEYPESASAAAEAGVAVITCHCGAARCRGVMPFDSSL